jgi:hypothetical protein
MKKWLPIFIAFVLGSALGWLSGRYSAAKAMQEAVLLFKAIELDQIETRARKAYSEESRDIAFWELSYLIERLQEALELRSEGPKSVGLKLFLANARLAKVLRQEGKVVMAEKYEKEAIVRHNQLHPGAMVMDWTMLEKRLEKFDEIAGIKNR